MARKNASTYEYDAFMNEARLILDPTDLVAGLLLRVARMHLAQTEIADVLGISATTYRQWEKKTPVLTGRIRERVVALNDWLDLVVGAHITDPIALQNELLRFK